MSDSDQPDAADVQVGESKPKRWVWSETDAFFGQSFDQDLR
jgi:hypothetical protein